MFRWNYFTNPFDTSTSTVTGKCNTIAKRMNKKPECSVSAYNDNETLTLVAHKCQINCKCKLKQLPSKPRETNQVRYQLKCGNYRVSLSLAIFNFTNSHWSFQHCALLLIRIIPTQKSSASTLESPINWLDRWMEKSDNIKLLRRRFCYYFQFYFFHHFGSKSAVF